MPNRRPNMLLTVSLAALLGALAMAPLHAQERRADTGAPVIEIETVAEAEAGLTQTFTAQVADDRELESVTLHHRRAGEQPFERITMSRLGESDYYGVSLQTDPADTRSVEYYVQAIDETGNRTVSGFAFDPRIRTLTQSSRLAVVAEPAAPRDVTSSSGTRWWTIALGVIAVGAVVSLAGSDGGGDDTVPLVIDLPEPVSR